jgi:large subunit ribosomal protein L36
MPSAECTPGPPRVRPGCIARICSLRLRGDRVGDHVLPAQTPGNAEARASVVQRVPAIASGAERGLIMKVRNSLRSLKSKPGSVLTRRRGRLVVINRKNPRWSGRQG